MRNERAGRIFACLLALLIAIGPRVSFAHEETFERTPDEVLDRMNRILAGTDEYAPPFADMVDLDDAGGFAFCMLDGEHMLVSGEANAFVRGRTDQDGQVDEIELIVMPGAEFGPEFGMQADRLSRVYMLSMFSALDRDEIELLMDSYLYDVRPYYYREGDEGVAVRERMCEIVIREQVVRIDSRAEEENALCMNITFFYEADEAMRERARENGWRIRRLAQAVNECDMLQTCGECLKEIGRGELTERAEEKEALAELILQSTQAVLQMETEHMHSQGVFLTGLQEKCALLDSLIVQMREAASLGDGEAEWERMQEICSLCAEIGDLPEGLY